MRWPVTFENARQYLARVVPWPQDGDAPFYVNVHWTAKAPDRDKPFWSGRATRSVQEATKTVEWALSLPDVRDIYLCLSSQRLTNEKISAKGKPYFLPIRSQDNAVALKSLFLDIDVKGGNGYPTSNDAAIALGQFLKDTGIPRPTMLVASGGGLHVYWVLDRAVIPYEWQPLADALAEATRQHGLKCDTVCTVDSARILRIPDTLNRKTEPARPVRVVSKVLEFDYSVERMEAALRPFIKAPEMPTLPPRPPAIIENVLAAGIESKADPINLDEVAKECAFIGDAITTGGKDYSNPMWSLTTLLSVFSVNGRADAHRMADQHPGYTQESTDELYDRKEKERESKGLGWPSCKSVQNSGCTKCAACPHFSEGKTPMHFRGENSTNTPSNQQATPTSDLPQGYVRDASGKVCTVGVNEQGITILQPVIDYSMKDPWLQRNPWILNFMAITHNGGQAQIALPLTACSTKEGVPRELSRQGLVLQEAHNKRAREFFVSWIATLQKSKNAVISSAPFGWNMRNGKIEGFVYGGSVWTTSGDRPAANTDPVIAAQYLPSGDIKAWTDAVSLITSQGRPALDAIIASSFGAPLVKFTGQQGMLLSTYSQESGIGKSTALKVAQAVWGDPIKAMQGLSDTQFSVVRKIGEIRSLPLYWDELKTEEDTKKFVQLTFQLTSGKERSRLSSDITQRDPGTWQTMLISASNESLVDHIASRTKMTTAGIYRIFEYEVPVGTKGQIDPSDAQRMVALLNDNYGTVGLEYAKYLGGNFAQIDIEVGDFQKKLGQEVNGQNDERFWLATVSCICMGAHYSNKLGFTQIDEPALKEFMLKVLADMRNQRKETHVDMRNALNVSNVLTQFLNAMRARHMLVTNRIHIMKGKPTAGSIEVKADATKLDGIYAHVGLDDKLLRISSTYLSEWLQERGYSRHMFNKALEREFGMRQVVGRIGSGTAYALGTEYLIQIDLAGTPLANFIEEA